ncbi:MAG: GFA family protein [Caulobacterales bacterium]
MRWRAGGCNCGAVRFEALCADVVEAEDCNCSICAKAGFLHVIVPTSAFRLIAGEAALETYRWNSGVALHRFCRVCGIKSFYIPRSNPDGVDVNARSFDDADRPTLLIAPFDGRNWEANGATLAHKSKP